MTGSGKKENPVTIVVSSSNRMGLFLEAQKLQLVWIGCDKMGINFDIVCTNRHSTRLGKRKIMYQFHGKQVKAL